MFTVICGIHFIVIQINILVNLGHGFQKADDLFRCSVKTTFLNVADVTYGIILV